MERELETGRERTAHYMGMVLRARVKGMLGGQRVDLKLPSASLAL